MTTDAGGVEQPRRIVAIAYVLAAIAVGIFLEKVLRKDGSDRLLVGSPEPTDRPCRAARSRVT